MKKTQSLKLMLLGLLIGFGSMTAFAADFFVNGGFVFEKVPGGVKVAGVTKVSSTGVITIGTNYKDSQDPDDEGGYNVVAIADNWYNPGTLTWVDSDGNTQSARTEDLRTKNFTLKIDAKELTSISTAALQPLNGSINAFIVTTDAGLTGIPAYAFANVPMKTVDNKNSQEYKDLEETINGIKALQGQNIEDTQAPIIEKGKFNATTAEDAWADGKNVYFGMKWKGANGWNPVNDDKRYWVLGPEIPGTEDKYGFKQCEVWRVELTEDNKGKLKKMDYTTARMRVDSDNKPTGELVYCDADGNLVEEVAFLLDATHKGPSINDELSSTATVTVSGLKTLAEEADQAWRNLVQARSNFLGVNLPESQVPYKQKETAYLTAKHKYDVQKKTDDALNAIYMTWLKASTDLKNAVKSPSPTNIAKLTEQSDKDAFDLIMETLFKAEYAQNDQKGYDIQDYAAVHQTTVNLRDAMNKAYDEWKSLIAYETEDVDAAYTNHNDELTSVNDGAQVKKGMTLEQLEAAIKAASERRTTTALALGAAEGADDTDLTELEKQLQKLATTEVPETNPAKFLKNEVLKKVQIDNNKMVTFGEAAFVNCVGVATEDWTAGTSSFLFPATTATIDAYAFKGTHINAKLGACAKNIQKIGDYAFQDTETQYVNLKEGTQITDKMIGKGVWNNTPLISIALNNTALTLMPNGLAQNIRRVKTLVEGCEAEGFYVQANTTLTSVGLPKGLTKIADNQFYWCLNLASVGTIPATVTAIGKQAFRGTAIQKFDLTGLKNLTTVGDLAFANNSALESVLFAAEAPFENLEGSTFQCDNNLNEVVFNDDLKCLPKGLFADTRIKKLDLSKTQVTVLPDLFLGSEEKALDANSVCNSLEEVILPETEMNKTNDEVLIPGLKVIANHAFAFMNEIKEITIPSSVWAMGTEVFAYCNSLEKVTAMDSRLTNLGVHTFRNCGKLKEVTFVTLSAINPNWTFAGDPRHETAFDETCDPVTIGGVFNFDDTQFFLCSNKVQVSVTKESYNVLKGSTTKPYAEEYSKLLVFEPTMTLTKKGTDEDGNPVFSDSYSNEYYGTWIPVDQATVYTAYQDLNEVYLFKAKHNNGYYKIPAVNSLGEAFGPTGDTPYWLTKGAVQENIWQYTANDGPNTDVAQGSPAVIIMTSNADGKFKYERHSLPGERYQSTLDRDNELKIAANKLTPNTTSNIAVWAKQDGNPTLFLLNDPNMVIAKGKVVFPLSAWQGTANSRINVIIVNDEVTSIKDYVKAVNDRSGAIYNLQGVRVSTPQKGQLYIQDGKKFIQK